MPDRTPSLPPSEPRPARGGRAAMAQLMGGAYERPARIQMIVALVLGLVLVAIPLYLWRRPRAESTVVADVDAGVAQVTQAADPAATDAGPPSGITLSAPVVVECHDPGPKKTSVDQCDHLLPFEQSFAKAIDESASCVPTSAGGGTLPFVADVSFQRKKTPILVFVAKDGRTLKSTKAPLACSAAVKKALSAFDLDPLQHAHSRYRISISATYPGAIVSK